MGLLTLMVGEVILLSFSIEANLGNLFSIYILVSFSDKLFLTIVTSHIGNWNLKGITQLKLELNDLRKKCDTCDWGYALCSSLQLYKQVNNNIGLWKNWNVHIMR
jgi:hypothetical protein